MITTKYSFKIKGMHCASCELWLENAIRKIPEIDKVETHLDSNRVDVWLSKETDETSILQKLKDSIKERSAEYEIIEWDKEIINPTHIVPIDYSQYLIATLIAIIFVIIFIFLQKLNILDLSGKSITYPYVFVIGFVASISTCAATIGSLVLSLSTSYIRTDSEKDNKHIWFFHISRLVSFFLLGGLLGIVGNILAFDLHTETIIKLVLQIFLILLGLNLLGFAFFEKLQLHLPKIFSSKTFDVAEGTSKLAPILLGMLTFLLPCGFTQSMQLQALSTKTFLDGALTMLIFALGTFPVLAGITKLSETFSKSKYKDLFFKVAGFVTIFLAVYQLYFLLRVYI